MWFREKPIGALEKCRSREDVARRMYARQRFCCIQVSQKPRCESHVYFILAFYSQSLSVYNGAHVYNNDDNLT